MFIHRSFILYNDFSFTVQTALPHGSMLELEIMILFADDCYIYIYIYIYTK